MAINKLESNGVQYAVEQNSILGKIDAPYGLSAFRWTVQKAGNTQEWYGLAKVARDVFGALAEIAQFQKNDTAVACAKSCYAFCASITKATIIPFLLGTLDKLVFEKHEGWVDTGQRLLKVTLAVALVGRVAFGLAVFVTPLNCLILIHYSVDVVKQGYRLYQVYRLNQNFNAKNQQLSQSETDFSKRIRAEDLTTLVNREQWMQPLRVVDAVISLAGEAFSQMCPAFKLVNTTMSALSSVYSMGITFCEDTQFSWKLKLL